MNKIANKTNGYKTETPLQFVSVRKLLVRQLVRQYNFLHMTSIFGTKCIVQHRCPFPRLLQHIRHTQCGFLDTTI